MTKVSISIITYNHEKYLADAIESVLMQKTNFPYEIIIGEDGSPDGTAEVAKAYQEKYPDKIKVFLNDRSNVIYVDGNPTGKWNLNNNIKHAKGEFVALLEGDDFWTDPNKLQKQVDFLEKNPELSFCFHDIQLVNSNAEKLNKNKLPVEMMKELTREELISGYYPCPPTGSIMYRRKYMPEFPEWFYKIKNGDIAITIILSEHGNGGFLEGKMSAYRLHATGAWHGKKLDYQLLTTIKMRKFLLDKFTPEGKTHNIKLIVDNYLELLKTLLLRFKLIDFLKYSLKFSQFLFQHQGGFRFLRLHSTKKK